MLCLRLSGRPLINIVRLSEGDAPPDVHEALTSWIAEPNRWDEGWATFLKGKISDYLSGKDTSIDLPTLAHDALTQAVDVGWSAIPKAA